MVNSESSYTKSHGCTHNDKAGTNGLAFIIITVLQLCQFELHWSKKSVKSFSVRYEQDHRRTSLSHAKRAGHMARSSFYFYYSINSVVIVLLVEYLIL